MATSENEYKFTKLKETDNYKQWNRIMTSTIQEA